ncbi:hypothetical protein [Metabacillus sp. 84]|uniref:hypothetical protein n=1 Tax=Metabacillus sp. 84 TaxID=3404705 RepID=UPI003CED0CA6
MELFSWDFILYLLIALLIWIPVFLLVPFPLRSEGKWLITGISFLLAVLYLAASQVLPMWQAILITVLLLGMAAYFVQQKGSSFLAAEGLHEEDDEAEAVYFDRQDDEAPLYSSAASKDMTETADEEEAYVRNEDFESAEIAEDHEQEEKTDEWETEWFAADPEIEELKVEQPQPSAEVPSEPELLEEWFENQELSDSSGSIELASVPEDRQFLNELAADGAGEKNAKQTELDAQPEISASEVSDDWETEWFEQSKAEAEDPEQNNSGEADEIGLSLSAEEKEAFHKLFEEPDEEEMHYDLDLQAMNPINHELDSTDPAESGSGYEIDSEEADFEPESKPEPESDPELEPEPEPIPEKGMQDDLLHALYDQLLMLKDTSEAGEFSAMMDEVLIQSKGVREYFVFVQLYLIHLQEAGQKGAFQYVYDEALEHLEAYPSLTEQLSWTNQQ